MKVAFAACLLALFGQCFVQGELDAVDDYTAWSANPTNGIKAQCNANKKLSPQESCKAASKGNLPGGSGSPPPNSGTAVDSEDTDLLESWKAMCTALGEYSCPDGDSEALSTAITDSNKCCTGKTTPPGVTTSCGDATADHVEGRSSCCGDCITAYKPDEPAPPPSPESPSEEGGNTTEKTGETTTAPATTQGPTPSSTSKPGDDDTTTMESTESATEGGSDSDSAINIGASGLLVTLITMMAAGVNIA